MAKKTKIKMLVSRGVPGAGKALRGETVEVSEFWAKTLVKDGSAEEVKSPSKKSKGKK